MTLVSGKHVTLTTLLTCVPSSLWTVVNSRKWRRYLLLFQLPMDLEFCKNQPPSTRGLDPKLEWYSILVANRLGINDAPLSFCS